MKKLFVILIACGSLVYGFVDSRNDRIKREMNKTELHYDADGYLILVNKNHNLVGLYDHNYLICYINADADSFSDDLKSIPVVVYGEQK